MARPSRATAKSVPCSAIIRSEALHNRPMPGLPGVRLGELARAVVDGRSVNWAEAAAGAGPEDRAAIEQLQLIAAINRRDAAADNALSPSGTLRVFDCIGHGANGEVYRAWDTRLDR